MDNTSLNWHIAYQAMPDRQKFTVDTAAEAVMQTIAARGFRVSNDDRAEALTAAIARYLVECQKPA